MSDTITRDDIDHLWKQFESIKATAEQNQFAMLFMYDMMLTPKYQDLQEHWDEGHARIFARAMTKTVFPKFGIVA